MDDDFEDDGDFAEQAAISFLNLFGAPTPKNRRFRLIDGVVLGLYGVHNICEAVTNTTAAAYNALASHANHGRDLEDMQEEAAREIESLTTGDDNG